MSGLLILIPLAVVCLYFLPTVIAFARGHHNAIPIAAVNLLLGWTVLGWIGSFIWSLTSPAPREVVIIHRSPDGPRWQ